MVTLISSNKGGDTSFSIEYGDTACWLVFAAGFYFLLASISCWLVLCSSAYSEEKFGTSA